MSEQAALRAPRAQRVVLAVALFCAGALSGIAAVVVHGTAWGLPLVVLAIAAALFALGPQRTTRGAFAPGFVAAVGLAAMGRPEGDYAISANVRGYALLILTLVVAVIAVVTLIGGPRPAPDDDVASGE